MADYDVPRPELDPNKFYSYTWPGEAPRVVSGTVLSLILKGADPAKLEISEVSGRVDRIVLRCLDRRVELIDEENLASKKPFGF